MVYRKTEKVLAGLEARRQSIIASAIDVLARSGMEGLTTDAVAARAGMATGMIYRFFPDKAEMVAAVFAKLLARDLEAIRAAAQGGPLPALADAIAVFYSIAQSPVGRVCGDNPIYRKNIEDELYGLIDATVDLDKTGVMLAAQATVGALYGLADAQGHRSKLASTALLFALRGIGVSDGQARKTVARMYGSSMVSA
jgi:AcrR family transcriptional regulator